ncbi:cobalt/nickel transport system permease protein [uncultured Gammaproteobacteria bacterium]
MADWGRMAPVDRYAWACRWRSYHPMEKTVLAAGLLVVALVLPPAGSAAPVMMAAFAATVIGAGVPVRAFLSVLAMPAGFLLAGLPALAVSIDTAAAFPLVITAEGLRQAVLVSARALAAMSCLALLILTTPVTDLVRLARSAGLPVAIADLAFLIHRLIFVFLERAEAGHHAQAARLGYVSFRASVRSLGMLGGGLLLRSLDRGRRLNYGLAARGYDGELRVLAPIMPVSCSRLAWAFVMIAGVALLSWEVGR